MVGGALLVFKNVLVLIYILVKPGIIPAFKRSGGSNPVWAIYIETRLQAIQNEQKKK